ncbi:hypothetical protein CR513_03329, partial [Mucuna pruriens]
MKGFLKPNLLRNSMRRLDCKWKRKGNNMIKGKKEVIFTEGTQSPNLRSNSLQEGENDAYQGGHD